MTKIDFSLPEEDHCDSLIEDMSQPECLRKFLQYNRLPAVCKCAGYTPNMEWIEPSLRQYVWTDPEPVLFAIHEGKKIRVVMASRFGDVGISYDLAKPKGYAKRVRVKELTDFSDKP